VSKQIVPHWGLKAAIFSIITIMGIYAFTIVNNDPDAIAKIFGHTCNVAVAVAIGRSVHQGSVAYLESRTYDKNQNRGEYSGD